jgi:DNA gyrase subunit B
MADQAASITVLEFPDNVRKRKEMYLPNKDYMVFEIIDNAIDEHNAGYCSAIALAIIDGKIIVEDNGRGIPVTPHPKFKNLSEAEVAYTVLHAGGKFGESNGYKTSTGGLHGVGASCVNALSQEMSLLIKTGGKKYRADFAKGCCSTTSSNISPR